MRQQSLRSYAVKQELDAEATVPPEKPLAKPTAKCSPHCTLRHLLQREITTHGLARGRAAAVAQANAAYHKGPWLFGLTGPGLGPVPQGEGRFIHASFSGNGDALAALCDYETSNCLHIINYRALQPGRLTAREYPDHHSMYVHRRILVPVCPASRPYFVAWNPQETTDVYTLDQHGVTRYDLSSDALPSPAEVERIEAQGWLFKQSGTTHLAFFASNAHLFATSSRHGQVCLWDVRQSRKSQELLGPRGLSQLCQVQVCPDGHVVIAGSPSGHIIMWDIRKGRSAAHQLGAYGPAKHPVLAVWRLRDALAAVPGLASETPIPDSRLTQLLLDPCDSTRAGYTLACGWQGCIDLRRPEITHAYCPPNDIMPLPGSRSAAGCAMWQPGSPFVSLHHRLKPAVWSWEMDNPTGSACLDILDFSSGCSSPCSVLGRNSQHVGSPSVTSMRMNTTAVTAAMHPTTHEIVVPGHLESRLFIISQLPNESYRFVDEYSEDEDVSDNGC